MAVDWFSVATDAIGALSAVAVAILTYFLYTTSHNLEALHRQEQERRIAVFELEWYEQRRLHQYLEGPRDFMVYIINRGGHASAIRRAHLTAKALVKGEEDPTLPVGILRPDGSPFEHLTIEPGARLLVRARFIVPPKTTLALREVRLHIVPVLGEPTSLLHKDVDEDNH